MHFAFYIETPSTVVAISTSTRAGHITDPQPGKHLAFHPMKNQSPRTGAVILYRNPFETPLTSQTSQYTPRQMLAAISNAQVHPIVLLSYP